MEQGVATLCAGESLRPQGCAVAPSGHVAVLDGRSDSILLFSPGGDPVGQLSWEAVGVRRPEWLGFSDDGSLLLFDAAARAFVRVR